MLVLGMACSHAPNLLLPVELWPDVYQLMIGGVPQPETASAETSEFRKEVERRIAVDLGHLRNALEAAKPDALIIVGDDQDEVFGPQLRPTLAVFCGDEVSGHTLPYYRDRPGVDQWVTLKGSSNLGRAIATGLTERDFDPVIINELTPIGQHEGIGHAFTRPSCFLELERLDIPIVPVFLNMYYDPLPSGRRCYDLGVALREIIDDRPERIAILGSGGLSHDPLGARAGWIDHRLDGWVLDRITQGRGKELSRLFAFDSDTVCGGTGELRAWIVAAGAVGEFKPRIVDYIPLHHAVTGLGFAYWSPDIASSNSQSTVGSYGAVG